MIFKHKTTSEMVKKLFAVIEKRVANNKNKKHWKENKLETTL